MRKTGAPEVVAVELPRTYGGLTGKGAAARNSDAILKLTYLVGVLAGRAMSQGIEVQLVPVLKWKGNVPKEITRKRVARGLGVEVQGLRSDEVDAIGLGWWWVKKNN